MNVARRAVRRRRLPAWRDKEPRSAGDVAGAVVASVTVHALVAGLTERQRTAVVLRYLAYLPYARIAEALGCAQATACDRAPGAAPAASQEHRDPRWTLSTCASSCLASAAVTVAVLATVVAVGLVVRSATEDTRVDFVDTPAASPAARVRAVLDGPTTLEHRAGRASLFDGPAAGLLTDVVIDDGTTRVTMNDSDSVHRPRRRRARHARHGRRHGVL